MEINDSILIEKDHLGDRSPEKGTLTTCAEAIFRVKWTLDSEDDLRT